ncbi:MAG: hypothetical protein KGZ39_01585 [Simkania sp.]|nr:hypothetical protein [Simkania sp.]
MYYRLTLCTFVILTTLTLAVLWLFAWPKKSDCSAYQLFAHQSRQAASHSAPLCQNRLKVCKDIWFAEEGNQRLHYRIESASSSLTLEPKAKHIDVIERLEQMRCWMQDKLLTGTAQRNVSQQTRYFTAREGTYHFLSQQLIADKATLSLYRMPGDTLPDIGCMPEYSPFLSGEAKRIALTVAGNTPTFQAYEFKAALSPVE